MNNQNQNMMDNYVINPFSGRKIKANGPTAKKLYSRGWRINEGGNDLLRLPAACVESGWVKDPITSHRIKINGLPYKKLTRQGWKLDLVGDDYTLIQGEPTKRSFIKNPFTNRLVEVGGKVYKELAKKLDVISNKVNEVKVEDSNVDDQLIPLSLKNKATKGMFRTYEANGNNFRDPSKYFDLIQDNITQVLQENLIELKGLKFQLKLNLEMIKPNLTTGQNILATPWFDNNMTPLTNEDEIPSLIPESVEKIHSNIDRYINMGSGWRINSVNRLALDIVKYTPLSGRSYMPLPKLLENRKGLVNIQNNDNECFKWCVTAALYPVGKHKDRVSKYKENSKLLNFDNITFPVKISDIVKFEKQNKVCVNVFEPEVGDKENPVRVLQISKAGYDKYIDLLLISGMVKENFTTHYVLITDFDKFMRGKSTHRLYTCKNCIVKKCYSQEALDYHFKICRENEGIKIDFPKDPNLHFKNIEKQLRVPFVIYADFESFLKAIPTDKIQNPKQSYTEKYQKHEANSWGYYVKCVDDSYSKFKMFRGRESGKKFIEYLEQEVKDIRQILWNNCDMEITDDEEREFNLASKCYLCNKPFLEEDGLNKVRDHCHLTGKYRGPAHSKCNLKFKYPKHIPVIIHNLSGYDTHLFIKEFGCLEGKLNCIPNTDEKYISFSHDIITGEYKNKKTDKKVKAKIELRFIDSFKFMASSLAKLVKNLDESKFTNMKKYFGEEQLTLLRRKGVYPYEYMDCEEKFQDTCLPPKEKFYSSLYDKDITDKNYEHAQNVWKTFSCETFGEYHDIYLKSDVLLLADVFENFRDMSLSLYKLDPAHYYTAPGLAWDALLKHSEVNLELLTDMDMILFLERGKRGGISVIPNKYAKANNKYMKDYDKEKSSSYIMYYDANNLYGWAMSEYLPTGGFRWLNSMKNFTKKWSEVFTPQGVTMDIHAIRSSFEIEFFDVMAIPDDYRKGYFLEVDLEYPKELHDLHNDYPLAAESKKIEDHQLSTYSNTLLDKSRKSAKVEKLIPNLMNKTNYVIHYRNLKQCLKLGMKVTKIHKILEFDQSPWMKTYIELNTEMRKKATNEFEKDFYKLMNNSPFGKTMENIRNRVDVQLVKSEKEAEKLVNQPRFKRFNTFDENLVAVHMKRKKLYFNKPIYVGVAILELSKTLMYDFHYDTIKKKYGEKAKLLLTDTDSLCYEIQTDDVYKDMLQDKHLYDLSDYDKHHFLYDTTNKKVLGKMKDEANGTIITEFVGLRSKLYCFQKDAKDDKNGKDFKDVKKAKGVKKRVVKKTLTIADYRNTLFTGEKLHRPMNLIKSEQHELYTQKVNKIALSSFDDKRYVLGDKITTLAHGHYLTNK